MSTLPRVSQLKPSSTNGDVVMTVSGAAAWASITEAVQDAIATSLIEGAGIDITYDDTANTITIAATGSYSAEQARDDIAAALVEGAGIDITVDDTANTITIAASGSGYSDEQARDAIAAALIEGSGIDIVVDDTANTITISATGGYTDEQVRDVIGAALVAGTGIDVSVNDAGDTITITNTGTGVGTGANNIGYDTEVATSAYTTITLGSTPVTNGEEIFVDGRLLSPTDDYTKSGAVITLLAPVQNLQRVTARWQTVSATPGGLTLSGTPGSPSIRASAIQYANNTASQGIAFPAGTSVGDRAILFAEHGFAAGTGPGGWTQLDNSAGSNVNGAVYTKLIDSNDLTTGSVAVSFGGTYYGELALAIMVGATAGIRETKTVRSGVGASPVSLTTVNSAAVTDTAIYFGSARADSSTTTVNRGTSLQSRSADTQASAALYYEDLTSSGTVTAQFSHSVAGSGYYEVIVIVKGV